MILLSLRMQNVSWKSTPSICVYPIATRRALNFKNSRCGPLLISKTNFACNILLPDGISLLSTYSHVSFSSSAFNSEYMAPRNPSQNSDFWAGTGVSGLGAVVDRANLTAYWFVVFSCVSLLPILYFSSQFFFQRFCRWLLAEGPGEGEEGPCAFRARAKKRERPEA